MNATIASAFHNCWEVNSTVVDSGTSSTMANNYKSGFCGHLRDLVRIFGL